MNSLSSDCEDHAVQSSPESTSSLLSAECSSINPFDSENTADTLHLPHFSPSVFAKQPSPDSVKKTAPFRWSIEQLAILHPADIDETMLLQNEATQASQAYDDEKTQKAIEMFFSRKEVAPSPWSSSSPPGQARTRPRPHPKAWPTSTSTSQPSSVTAGGTSQTPLDKMVSSSSSSPPSRQRQGVDVGCQTSLTLPVNFDLAALLGGDWYSEEEEESQQAAAAAATSSLRRKLFFQNQQHTYKAAPCPPLLPSGGKQPGPGALSPPVTPVKISIDLPSPSCNFSSSPIAKVLPSGVTCDPYAPLPVVTSVTPSISPISKPASTSAPRGKTPSATLDGGVALTPCGLYGRVPITPCSSQTRRSQMPSPELSPIESKGSSGGHAQSSGQRGGQADCHHPHHHHQHQLEEEAMLRPLPGERVELYSPKPLRLNMAAANHHLMGANRLPGPAFLPANHSSTPAPTVQLTNHHLMGANLMAGPALTAANHSSTPAPADQLGSEVSLHQLTRGSELTWYNTTQADSGFNTQSVDSALINSIDLSLKKPVVTTTAKPRPLSQEGGSRLSVMDIDSGGQGDGQRSTVVLEYQLLKENVAPSLWPDTGQEVKGANDTSLMDLSDLAPSEMESDCIHSWLTQQQQQTAPSGEVGRRHLLQRTVGGEYDLIFGSDDRRGP